VYTSVGTGHGIQITLAGTYSFQEIHLLDAATNGSTGNEKILIIVVVK
jgi:hypothetical protein